VCGNRPCGGGLFMVEPPCRLDANGADTFPRLPTESIGRFVAGPGWYPSEPYTYRWFGNVWPLHGQHTTVVWADGHASSRTIPSLTHGCDVRDDWGGRIYDASSYLWDLN
jgi:prepilin-type processing-associated H-X9-DG protein